METELKQEIESLIRENPVVLFMKGTRSFPQCGFSATVVGILRESGVKQFRDVNILQRADLREAMKAYTNWPTFPQLYVGGQFVGGCDIVKEMFASGELYGVLGVEPPEVKEPTIRVTDAAKQAIAAATEGEGGALRIEISPQFEHALSIDGPQSGDLALTSNGISLLVDRQSASRADGLVVDYVDGGDGGFRLENPNEPPRVRPVSVRDLKAKLEQGEVELIDVRTPQEWATAHLAQAKLFDDQVRARLDQLDRATPLYFMCHHGHRSQQAAEHYLRQGFTEVYNVIGGIEAWSCEIDPSVPRY